MAGLKYYADEEEDSEQGMLASDFIILKSKSTAEVLRDHVCSIRALLVAVLGAVALFSVVLLSTILVGRHRDGGIDPACLHALGGGRTASQGGFKHVVPHGCAAQLDRYSCPGGAYWKEVALAAHSAQEYYKSQAATTPPQATSVVVFDIDETALSNVGHFLSPSNADSDDEWDAWVHEAAAPAIKPVLELYQQLYASGASVAFVTGRGERGRVATVANLASAGYGQQCPTQGGQVLRTAQACWVRLYMRGPEDTQLASVYKPAQRQALATLGYTLYGSIGDQFSDLSGEHPASASFKLPNPFYYIL